MFSLPVLCVSNILHPEAEMQDAGSQGRHSLFRCVVAGILALFHIQKGVLGSFCSEMARNVLNVFLLWNGGK